jgi:hypothetical protein
MMRVVVVMTMLSAALLAQEPTLVGWTKARPFGYSLPALWEPSVQDVRHADAVIAVLSRDAQPWDRIATHIHDVDGPWRAGLAYEVGKQMWRQGRLSETLDAWQICERALDQAPESHDRQNLRRLLMLEQASYAAWLGDLDRAAHLLKDVPVALQPGMGADREQQVRARIAHGAFDPGKTMFGALYGLSYIIITQSPEKAFLDVSNTVRVILEARGSYGANHQVTAPRVTLSDMREVATTLGLPLRFVHVTGDIRLPPPFQVLWHGGHVSTAIATRGDAYVFKDVIEEGLLGEQWQAAPSAISRNADWLIIPRVVGDDRPDDDAWQDVQVR